MHDCSATFYRIIKTFFSLFFSFYFISFSRTVIFLTAKAWRVSEDMRIAESQWSKILYSKKKRSVQEIEVFQKRKIEKNKYLRFFELSKRRRGRKAHISPKLDIRAVDWVCFFISFFFLQRISRVCGFFSFTKPLGRAESAKEKKTKKNR